MIVQCAAEHRSDAGSIPAVSTNGDDRVSTGEARTTTLSGMVPPSSGRNLDANDNVAPDQVRLAA